MVKMLNRLVEAFSKIGKKQELSGENYINSLPEELLSSIFKHIPSHEICRNLALTCRLWKSVIDADTFWTEKLLFEKKIHPKIIRELVEKDVYNPKKLCFRNPYSENLLKNPCGEQGFDFWNLTPEFDLLSSDRKGIKFNPHIKQNILYNRDLRNKQGFLIEDDHTGSQPITDDKGKVLKNFATSYFMCQKYQLVDLVSCGLETSLLKKVKPRIQIKDFYAARFDCGAEYHIGVMLLDENLTVVESVIFDETIEQGSENDWHEYSHEFKDYDESVRYVLFFHGGKDTQFWAGNYGVKLSKSRVNLAFE